jgi:hypothetical protein
MVSLKFTDKDICLDSNQIGMTLLLCSCSGGYARLSVELLSPGRLIVFIPGTSWRLVPRLPVCRTPQMSAQLCLNVELS